MAFFEHSHGMQINGGNFYNVAGGMNIQRQLPSATEPPELVRGMGSRIRRYLEFKEEFLSQKALVISHIALPVAVKLLLTSTIHQVLLSLQPGNTISYGSSAESDAATNGEHRAIASPIGEPGQHRPMTNIYGGTFVNNSIRRESERAQSYLPPFMIPGKVSRNQDVIPKRARKSYKISMNGHWKQLHRAPFFGFMVLLVRGNPPSCKLFPRNCTLRDAWAVRSFFKRDHATRGNAKALFTTIAYQLALSVPWLKAQISRIVEEDPSILGRSIQTQLLKLISEPSHHSSVAGDHPRTIILIDGLDECEGQHIQEEILRAIRISTSQYYLPFRFVVASRPEAHIGEMFESPLYRGGYSAFNVEQSFEDVRKYLGDEFSRIHREHRTMVNIPSPWPCPEILEELVSKSSGYFIYATTVIKFIDDKHYRPTERLAVVQEGAGSDTAFDALDQLYMQILSSVKIQPKLLPLLCAVTNFDFTLEILDRLLKQDDGDARLLLRGLHSVLWIPEADDHLHVIDSYHASFFEFLNNPQRSHNFYIGSVHHRINLARALLGLFAGEFRADIEGSWGYYARSPLSFVSFVISIPPCAELLLPIQLIRPDYVFELSWPHVDTLLPWLQQIPGVPEGLEKLWEDYEYMSFFVYNIIAAKSDPAPSIKSPFPFQYIVLQNPGMLRFLQIMLLAKQTSVRGCLRKFRSILGFTWDDLKTTICALRPIIGRDGSKMRELVNHLLDSSFSGETYPWPSLCRDVAQQLICRVRDADPPQKGLILIHFPFSLGHLIRSSPFCPQLLYLVWATWNDLRHRHGYGYNRFPDPPPELLAFCRQRFENLTSQDRKWHRHLWRKHVNPRRTLADELAYDE
ncbi:NACHT domain-containing protein [Mycena sanguinolenta]|uniref:NACHT domain-containing protein n=1 Tax=Mycena sanguinolenta TaxID=230812 RepID=A0A8H6ZFY2_9AGAR|nr:NACHT domain-containing protein [Mycena sanguinolenta]